MTKTLKPEPPGQAVLRLKDLIASTGIQLVLWSKVIESTDPNESYAPFAQMAEDMLTHSEVLALVEEQFPVLAEHMRIKLPPHIGAVAIKNPLRVRDSEDPLPFDKGSTSDMGDEHPF